MKHSKTSLPIYLLWAFSWLPYLEIFIIFLWRDPEFCHNVSRKVLVPSPRLPPKMHYRTAEYIPCIPFSSNHATQCIITNASCLQHSALFCKRAIDDESLLCQACYGCHYFVLGPISSKEILLLGETHVINGAQFGTSPVRSSLQLTNMF